MGLFLYSLELSEEEDRGVVNGVGLALFLGLLAFLLDEVGKNGVVNGQAVDVVQLLYQFETHRASHSAVPKWLQGYM